MSPLLVALLATASVAEPPTVVRMGRVIIEGNTFTPDHWILNHFPGYPGQPLPTVTQLQACERRMLLAFHPRFDLDAGRWPTVVVLADEDSAFKDVRITFRERPAPAVTLPLWLHVVNWMMGGPNFRGHPEWLLPSRSDFDVPVRVTGL